MALFLGLKLLCSFLIYFVCKLMLFLLWSCVRNHIVEIPWFSSLITHRKKNVSKQKLSPGPWAYKIFWNPFPQYALSLSYRACVVCVSITTGQPMILSLTFDKIGLSLTVSVCCKASFFGERWKIQFSVRIRKFVKSMIVSAVWLAPNTLASYCALHFILTFCLFLFVIIHSIYFLQV